MPAVVGAVASLRHWLRLQWTGHATEAVLLAVGLIGVAFTGLRSEFSHIPALRAGVEPDAARAAAAVSPLGRRPLRTGGHRHRAPHDDGPGRVVGRPRPRPVRADRPGHDRHRAHALVHCRGHDDAGALDAGRRTAHDTARAGRAAAVRGAALAILRSVRAAAERSDGPRVRLLARSVGRRAGRGRAGVVRRGQRAAGLSLGALLGRARLPRRTRDHRGPGLSLGARDAARSAALRRARPRRPATGRGCRSRDDGAAGTARRIRGAARRQAGIPRRARVRVVHCAPLVRRPAGQRETGRRGARERARAQAGGRRTAHERDHEVRDPPVAHDRRRGRRSTRQRRRAQRELDPIGG